MPNEPWPDKTLHLGDSFIKGVRDRWHLNACIGPQLSDTMALTTYADGFRSAGRRLVDELIESGNRIDLPLDTVVYPIAFLYRHHFELLLKLILRECDLVNQGPGDFPTGHRLLKLWEECQKKVEMILVGADWSQNATVEALFKELEAVDPIGQAARYPYDTAGRKSFDGMPLLNVEHFAETADRLSDYLETILTGVESRREE